MANKRHLASLTILIKDRQSQANDLQQLLTDNGHIIMARLGVNVEPKCINHCTGMIVLTLDGGLREIKALTKKIDEMYGVVAKVSVMTR